MSKHPHPALQLKEYLNKPNKDIILLFGYEKSLREGDTKLSFGEVYKAFSLSKAEAFSLSCLTLFDLKRWDELALTKAIRHSSLEHLVFNFKYQPMVDRAKFDQATLARTLQMVVHALPAQVSLSASQMDIFMQSSTATDDLFLKDGPEFETYFANLMNQRKRHYACLTNFRHEYNLRTHNLIALIYRKRQVLDLQWVNFINSLRLISGNKLFPFRKVGSFKSFCRSLN